MIDLKKVIQQTKSEKNEIAVIWLGQAGFVLKGSCGKMIAIDPYLSDYCEKTAGFKRIMPKLIDADELCVDVLISTHDHPDHFDEDAVPELIRQCELLVGAPSSVAHAEKLECDKDKLKAVGPGDAVELDWCSITAVYADHGTLAPDAVGFVIEMDGVKVYYTGDTAFRRDKIEEIAVLEPDIIIPPINGEYGNLNSSEAVALTKEVGAKLVIPCHFWMFAMHRGDPQEFADEAEKRLEQAKYYIMSQGEAIKFRR